MVALVRCGLPSGPSTQSIQTAGHDGVYVQVPFRFSGYDALDIRWVVPVPGLTGPPSHLIALATSCSRSPLQPSCIVIVIGQCRLVAGTIGLATDHSRPDDPGALFVIATVASRMGFRASRFVSGDSIAWSRLLERTTLRWRPSCRAGAAHLDGHDHDGLRIARREKAAIIRVIDYEPAFAEMFMLILARTIRVEADLVDQLFNSSENVLPECSRCWRTSGRKQLGTDYLQDQPGDACGDDRNDPVPRKLLHLQISRTRLH